MNRKRYTIIKILLGLAFFLLLISIAVVYLFGERQMNLIRGVSEHELISIIQDNLILITAIVALLITIIGIIITVFIWWLDKKLKKFQDYDDAISKSRELLNVNVNLVSLHLASLTTSQQIPNNIVALIDTIVSVIFQDKEIEEFLSHKSEFYHYKLLKAQLCYCTEPDNLPEILEQLGLHRNFNLGSIALKLEYYSWKGIFYRQIGDYTKSIAEFVKLYELAESNNPKYIDISYMGICLTIFAFIKNINFDLDKEYYIMTLNEIIKFDELRNIKTKFGFSIQLLKKWINELSNDKHENEIRDSINFILLYITFSFMVSFFRNGGSVMIAMNLLKVSMYLEHLLKVLFKSNEKTALKIGNLELTIDIIEEFRQYEKECFQVVSKFDPEKKDSPNILTNYFYNQALAHYYMGFNEQANELIDLALKVIKIPDVKYIYSEEQEKLILKKRYIDECKKLKEQIKNKIDEFNRLTEFWEDYYLEGKFIYGLENSRLAEKCITDTDIQRILRGNVGEKKRFLEIGCGYGRDLKFFVEKIPNVEFHGLDCSKNAIDYIGRFIINPNSNIYLTRGDIYNLPTEIDHNSYFDIIYAHFFFHLFDEIKRRTIVEKCLRLLKPNGLLIVSVISLNDRLYRIYLKEHQRINHIARSYDQIYPFKERPWYPLSFFTEKKIREEFDRYGNLEFLRDENGDLEINEIENVEGLLRGTKYFAFKVIKSS